jgi:hypothetical protein
VTQLIMCTKGLHELGPWTDQAQGLGLVAQIMFGSRPGSMIVTKRYIEHIRLSRKIFFAKKQLFVVMVIFARDTVGLWKQIPPTSFSWGFS